MRFTLVQSQLFGGLFRPFNELTINKAFLVRPQNCESHQGLTADECPLSEMLHFFAQHNHLQGRL